MAILKLYALGASITVFGLLVEQISDKALHPNATLDLYFRETRHELIDSVAIDSIRTYFTTIPNLRTPHALPQRLSR